MVCDGGGPVSGPVDEAPPIFRSDLAAEAAAAAEEVALKEKEAVLAAELADKAREADQQQRDAREKEDTEKQRERACRPSLSAHRTCNLASSATFLCSRAEVPGRSLTRRHLGFPCADLTQDLLAAEEQSRKELKQAGQLEE